MYGWVIISAALAALAFLVYLMFRNDLVYRARMRILCDPTRSMPDCFERLGRLPSRKAMVWQLFTFRWDVEGPEKFAPKPPKEKRITTRVYEP